MDTQNQPTVVMEDGPTENQMDSQVSSKINPSSKKQRYSSDKKAVNKNVITDKDLEESGILSDIAHAISEEDRQKE